MNRTTPKGRGSGRAEVEWGPGSRLALGLREFLDKTAAVSKVTGSDLVQGTQDARDARRRQDPNDKAVTIGRTRAAELLGGGGAPPTWEQILLSAQAAALKGPARNIGAFDEEALQSLWAAAQRAPAQPSAPISTSYHFARCLNAWGEDKAQHGAGLSATVSVAHSDPREAPYETVFDYPFQERLVRIQESSPLRRDGHAFTAHVSSLSTGFRVWGPIETGRFRGVRTFVGVEVNSFGGVSVFFRDYQRDGGGLDELVAHWIRAAWAMCLVAHGLIGAQGAATACVIVNGPGAVGLRQGRSDFLLPGETSFATLNMGATELLVPQERGNWVGAAEGAAARQMAAVHAKLTQGAPNLSAEPWSVEVARSKLNLW